MKGNFQVLRTTTNRPRSYTGLAAASILLLQSYGTQRDVYQIAASSSRIFWQELAHWLLGKLGSFKTNVPFFTYKVACGNHSRLPSRLRSHFRISKRYRAGLLHDT